MLSRRTSASSGARLVVGVLAFTSAVFTATYLIALSSGVEAVEEWSVSDESWTAVGVSTLLLVGDAFVPVPSSLLLVGLGAVLPLPVAFALAFGARTVMSLACYAVGRFARRVATRLVSAEEDAAARQMFERYGVYAILISRPLPVVGESVLVVAGITRTALPIFLLAAAVASAAEAGAYVLLGQLASEFRAIAALWLVLVGIAIGIALASGWSAGDRSRRPPGAPSD